MYDYIKINCLYMAYGNLNNFGVNITMNICLRFCFMHTRDLYLYYFYYNYFYKGWRRRVEWYSNLSSSSLHNA